MALLRILLCGVMLLTTTAVAQSGQYMDSIAGGILSGKYTFSVTGAHGWGVGTTNEFRLKLAGGNPSCNDIVLTLQRTSTFISATIRNDYACHCYCGWGGGTKCCIAKAQGGDQPAWHKRHVPPFSIQFVDVSSTAAYVLPTRENAPKNMPLESYTMTAPKALDARLATPLMNVYVTCIPRETNFIQWVDHTIWPYKYIPECAVQADYHHTLYWPEGNAMNSLGWFYQFRGCWTGTYSHHSSTWYVNFQFRRLPPSPSFIWKMRRSRTSGSYQSIGNYITWTRTFLGQSSDIKNFSYSNDGYSETYTYDNDHNNMHRTAAEFYENKRFQSAEETFSLLDLKASLTNGTDVEYVVLNGSTPITMRITWPNVTHNSYNYPHRLVEDAPFKFAVHFTQPYPIQDAWLTIYDSAGNRLFTGLERQVPYKQGTGAGQLGWLLALNGKLHDSDDVTMKFRWNRRSKLGTTPEATRALLLYQWTKDKGGRLDGLTVPVPKTIDPTPGVMGGIAAKAAVPGDRVIEVPWLATIHGNHSLTWYNNVVMGRFNTSDEWQWRFNNTAEQPYEKDLISLTLFCGAMGTSPRDNATNAWVITDSFYPEVPAMLPHFWDAQTLNRLYGHTQLVTFMADELNKWAAEYAIIADKWPWFGREMTLQKYQWLRAHVRRSTTFYEGRGVMIPLVNLLRHTFTGPPNVDIEWDQYWEMVYLVANTNIAQYEEIFPNFNAASFTKSEFLLNFGYVPPAAIDVATVAGYKGYLYNTDASRQSIVNEWKVTYSETYKQALARLLTAMGASLASLPLTIDGLGSTPAMVNQATMIMNAERTVLQAQIAAGNAEYASL